MAWWGKLVGGTFGFMMGGPLGALMGVALGDLLGGGRDSDSMLSSWVLVVLKECSQHSLQRPFPSWVLSQRLMARLQKMRSSMAEQVMQQMNLNSHQRSIAINLFNEGKKSDFPAEEVLIQFKRVYTPKKSHTNVP